MKIKSARFIISAANRSQYPTDSLMHIALAGKSNVGKSSLINAITGRSKLALVSSEPGKTRLINFYLINESFYLVDLPGYGYARVSKAEKQRWGSLIDEYLANNRQLGLIIMLADIRHDPTTEDMQMAEWVRYYNIPVIIAATKSDKLGKSRVKPRALQIRKDLGFSDDVMIIPCSSVSKQGIEELNDAIGSFVEESSSS
ncbi:MAG TPA: ribosome biogenesis GTP-binding protein YihA/YsxC [Candidatus Atribacteria bacterium]|nr:ribosome biogenesis GTP-binding protein YihA/YsxC [Candidatus Atribacteria bacterium]HPT79337.1 ribosome biogenesis GTP-binding protein YihA/YsxC [Candidatus Atribacteria bacterium]